MAERLGDLSGRRLAAGDGRLSDLQRDDGLDKPLLDAVVNIALQPSAGLVGGRNGGPGAEGREVRLVSVLARPQRRGRRVLQVLLVTTRHQ